MKGTTSLAWTVIANYEVSQGTSWQTRVKEGIAGQLQVAVVGRTPIRHLHGVRRALEGLAV